MIARHHWILLLLAVSAPLADAPAQSRGLTLPSDAVDVRIDGASVLVTDAHGHRTSAARLGDADLAPAFLALARHDGLSLSIVDARAGTPARTANAPTTALSDASWEALGPFGGDVTDVAAHPVIADLLFATVATAASATVGGLFRSTNGGASWTDVAPAGMGGTFALTFGPDGRLWAGTFNSPWVSADDGLTWTKRNLGIGLNDATLSVAVDPVDGDVVYATVAAALGLNDDVIFGSSDGGLTWAPLNVTHAPNFDGTAVATNADGTKLAAGFSGAFGAGGQVFVSTNGGGLWVNRTFGLPPGIGPINRLVWHDGDLYVAGGQLFGGNAFGLWRSSSDGLSWTELSGDWSNKACNDVAAHPATSVLLAAVAGTGVLRSDDGGATWTEGFGGTGGLSATAVAFDLVDGTRLAAGTDAGGPWIADDGASFVASATGMSFLDVYGIASDRSDPGRLAVAFQSQNSGGVFTSSDGGATWDIATGLPGERFNDVHYDASGRLFALADGPTTIGTEGVWRSEDNGDSWESLGPDFGPVFETELFGITSSAADPDLVLVGGSDFGVAGTAARIYRSEQGGGAWDNTWEGAPGVDVQSLSFDDAGGAGVVAGTTDFSGGGQGGVVASADAGESWVPAANWPNGGTIFAVAHDPFLADRAWCTNAVNTNAGGLWRSDDGGLTFTKSITWANARYLAKSPVRETGAVLCTFDGASTSETTDGVVLTPFAAGLADVGASTRALRHGWGTPPRALLATNRGTYHRVIDALAAHGTPGLGAELQLRFTGRPGFGWRLWVSLTPGDTRLGELGTLGIAPPWRVLVTAPLPPQGLVETSFPISDDPAWSGLTLLFQAAAHGTDPVPFAPGAVGNLEQLDVP